MRNVAQCRLESSGVEKVAVDPAHAVVEIGRPAVGVACALGMLLRYEAIENGDLVIASQQHVGEVRADEACAAGNQDMFAHRSRRSPWRIFRRISTLLASIFSVRCHARPSSSTYMRNPIAKGTIQRNHQTSAVTGLTRSMYQIR